MSMFLDSDVKDLKLHVRALQEEHNKVIEVVKAMCLKLDEVHSEFDTRIKSVESMFPRHRDHEGDA